MTLRTFLILLWAGFLPVFLIRLALFRPINLPESKVLKITSRITTQPYQKGSNQYFYLGPVLVKASPYPGYFYGQKIELISKLEKRVINPFKIIYFTKRPAIRLIEASSGEFSFLNLKALLFKARGHLEGRLVKLLPEPHGSLMLGILLGVKQNFSSEFLQNLIKTGTIHLVVASGQNVVFFAGIIIESLLLFTHRRVAVAAGILTAFLYCLLAGAEAPVVRATLMVSFAYLAVLFGRQANRLIGFSLAVILLLLLKPLYLFDLGFQLSVAATSGLILVLPKLDGLLKKAKINLPGIIREGFLVTLSAQITTFPIIALTFGTFSLSSFVSNLLIIPLIPFMLMLSFLTLFFGLFFAPLGQFFAYLAFPFLEFFIQVVNFLSQFGWANVSF